MVKIDGKVRDILLVRNARNRTGDRITIPLSPAAQAIATGGGLPSQNWFMRFFTFHARRIRTLTFHRT